MRSLLVLITLLLPSALAAQSQMAVQQTPPQIVTTGRGQADVSPDQATVMVGVETRAVSAAAATSLNASRQAAVIAALQSRGVSRESISTIGFSVEPQVSYDQKADSQRIIGYTVRNTVRVELRSIAGVGEVLDAALKAGANVIRSLDFSSTHEDEARRSALTAAVQSARADAEAMARAAGGGLGELIDLTSTETPSPQPFLARAEVAAGAVPISPGTQAVTATVQARWQFVSAKP